MGLYRETFYEKGSEIENVGMDAIRKLVTLALGFAVMGTVALIPAIMQVRGPAVPVHWVVMVKVSPARMVIPLTAVASVIVSIAYAYSRMQQYSITLEQNVEVAEIEVNKTAVLVSVTLINNGPSLIIEGASLVKIQSGITLTSSKFSPPMILYTANATRMPLSYQLDKEEADYFLYLYTSKGTAVRCRVSYP